jgi:hypothetical protein
MATVHIDNPCSDLVPVDEGLCRAVFADRDWRNIPQQITQGHRLTGDDLANLIERHHRIPQRAHIGLVRRLLVPASALEIVIDQIATVRFQFLCQQIFKGAAP